MSLSRNLRKIERNVTANRLPTTRIIAVAFALIIVTGGLLLMLPAASRSGESAGIMKAMFTSTSATCVTGLVLEDTFVQWSGFGQIVILALIQIGGLGFMSVASIFVFMLRKKVGMKQRLLLAQAMSLNEIQGVVRLQKHVLIGTFVLEGFGAVVLFLRFFPEYGLWNGFKWGIFHSISAFCNAGFDIFGVLQPGSSIALFKTDPVVCLTLMFLIQMGGLGFFVWEELFQALVHKKLLKITVYSKLVLICTGAMLLLGTVVTAILEWDNPQTLGNMAWYEKILAAAFQSTTLRTAGFAGLDQGALHETTKAASVAIMLVGGSSGSTAGGIKTVTVALLILATFASARGKSHICVFKRTIPEQQVRDAMSLAFMILGLCFSGAIFIAADSGVSFVDAIFETASALATVGVTANITPILDTASKVLLIIFMYFGRVGVLTLSLGFLMGDQAEERYRYAETKLLIG